MNYEELIALPENGGLEYTERPHPTMPGITQRNYHMKRGFAMTHKKTDVMIFYDKEGQAWTTGSIDGVLHKSRIRGFDGL